MTVVEWTRRFAFLELTVRFELDLGYGRRWMAGVDSHRHTYFAQHSLTLTAVQ